MRSPRRLGVPVVVHPEARAILERYYADKGGVNEARLRMARVPEGAELIRNQLSGAPGIRIGNLFLLAGVPHITAGMLDALSGTLEGGRPLVSVTVGALAPESEVADLLREAERRHEGSPSAATPSSSKGGSAPTSSSGRRMQQLAQAVAEDLPASWPEVGYEPVAGGI